MEKSELESIFTYYPPMDGQIQRYQTIRNKALELALLINEQCPKSREQSLAFSNLQSTVMWANAAIAIHEEKG